MPATCRHGRSSVVARSFGQLTIGSLMRGEVEQTARMSGGLLHFVTLRWDAESELFVVTYSKTNGPTPVFRSMYWYADVDLARARFAVDNRSF